MAIPNSNLPQNTVKAVQLRARSSSGSKDWVAVYTTDPKYKGKLYVINGKTSDVMNGGGQGRPVKTDGINLQQAVRTKEDSGKGYVFVDEYDVGRGWMSEKRSSTPPQPAPTPIVAPKTEKTSTTTKPAPQAKPAAQASILSNPDGEETGCWFC